MAIASLRHGVTIAGAILLVTGTLCFAWWSDGEMGVTAPSSDPKVTPQGETELMTRASSSSPVLRSISFFCCGIGGLLLLFGLLWSANAGIISRHYQYHFSSDLQYSTVEPLEKQTCRCLLRVWKKLRSVVCEYYTNTEEICITICFLPCPQRLNGTWEATSIPTYEEALNCQPAENASSDMQSQISKEIRLPLYQVVDENHKGQGSRRRSSSDGVLFRNIPPKPSLASRDEAIIVCDTPPPSYESIGLCDG